MLVLTRRTGEALALLLPATDIDPSMTVGEFFSQPVKIAVTGISGQQVIS